jgi:DNA repair protein RadD
LTELRGYQEEIVTKVEQHRRPIIVAPTGSGKTVIAAEIIRRAEDSHVLFLDHRRELNYQAVAKLADFGVNAGLILAGEPMNQTARVQVASVQTFDSRYIRGDNGLPHADIVFIDEAHHARARTYRQIIDAYPDARVIGMTATPCRRDGRGLGNVFDAMVECPQVQELIELGYLVKTKVFAPCKPNLKGVQGRKKHTNINPSCFGG